MALSAETLLQAIWQLFQTGSAQVTVVSQPLIGRAVAVVPMPLPRPAVSKEYTLQSIYTLLATGAATVTVVGF